MSLDQVRSNNFSFRTLFLTCTMSQVWRLEKCDVMTCDADTYFESLDYYLVENSIPDATKVSTFISLASGPKTYSLFLNSPKYHQTKWQMNSDIMNAEIRVPSAGNADLSKVGRSKYSLACLSTCQEF